MIVHAQSSERAALVIGNQNYAMAPLDTPESDASAMANSLHSVGYRVTQVKNLKQSHFYDAVDNFFSGNKNAKVILFFYAGHAVQINGKNFLIPIDAQKEDPDILSRMFDLRYLINKISESKAETKLVILDSCRDNLFSSHPNAANGLSELLAPSGTFVAFSTAPGATAADGTGDNSPYTSALLESLFRPGVKVEDAFKDVRRKVRFATENEQTPWESTSLIQDFYIVPGKFKTGLSTAKNINSSILKSQQNNIAPTSSAGGIKDAKMCSRLMAKMSMGITPLSSHEQSSLAKCH